VRALDSHFGQNYFSLRDLFLEDRRRIINKVIEDNLTRFEGTYKLLYNENLKLMNYVRELDAPIPRGFLVAAEYVLTGEFSREVEKIPFLGIQDEIHETLENMSKWGVKPASESLTGLLQEICEGHFKKLARDFALDDVKFITDLLDLCDAAGIKIQLWILQNFFHRYFLHNESPRRLDQGFPPDPILRKEVIKLGRRLEFALPFTLKE
jgi:hypothetical protein